MINAKKISTYFSFSSTFLDLAKLSLAEEYAILEDGGSLVDFDDGVRIVSFRFFFDGDGEIVVILFIFLLMFDVSESEKEVEVGFCSKVPLFIVISLKVMFTMFSRNCAGFIFDRS
jgi:hypothetical protein